MVNGAFIPRHRVVSIIVMDYRKTKCMREEFINSTEFYTYMYFKQGSNVIEPDSIQFNFKTKAYIRFEI
jgi:hypothetical protein